MLGENLHFEPAGAPVSVSGLVCILIMVTGIHNIVYSQQVYIVTRKHIVNWTTCEM